MNEIVYKHYDQYEDLNAYYQKNKAKFAKYPKIVAYFEKIETNRGQLNKLGVVKGEKVNLVPERLRILKEEMGLAIHANSYPAANYYKAKGDVDMHKQLKHDKITLQRNSYVKTMDIANKIINTCTPRLKELKEVGVTAASLKKITEAKENYVAFKEHKDYVPMWKQVMTKKVHDLDKETIKLVKTDLTNAMDTFVNQDRQLHNEYIAILKNK